MILIETKLRCSGQRSGCNRCTTASVPCVYSPATHSRGTQNLNKHGISAWRKTIEKRRTTRHTEKARSRQVSPPRKYLDSYGHGLTHITPSQDVDHSFDQQPPQRLSQQNLQNSAMVHISCQTSMEEFSPILAGFEDHSKTSLYEPQMSTGVDFLDYSVGADDPWASFTAVMGNPYFADPIGMTYDNFQYGDDTYKHSFASLTPLSPCIAASQHTRE